MASLDIKLLRVFVEIFNARNISQAAVVLGLSQPTASLHLSKLRTHFGDALFVRSSQGMEPTPFAIELYELAVAALSNLSAASNFQAIFDPARSERCFRLATIDLGHVALIPRLINRVTVEAPHASLQHCPIGLETAALLESGGVDIAIGFMPELDAGFYQQTMFSQRYVCIASKNHGFAATGLTPEAFLKADHVRVIYAGTGHLLAEKLLQEKAPGRRVVLEVSNYLGLLEIVAQTRLLAVVPEALTNTIQPGDRHRIDVLPLPGSMAVPEYQVTQYWHARNHRDPGHRWLRGLLSALFTERPGTQPGRASADLPKYRTASAE